MSLRNITEDEKPLPEVGRYGKISIAVGYSQKMGGYYARLSDLDDPSDPVFVINRSDAGYLAFIQTDEFLSALHRSLDSRGVYVEGDERELAKIVSDLTLQLMEKRRNEPQ